MTPKRLIAVLLFFFVTALAVAHLQAQKVRYARRIAYLNHRVLQLNYHQWDEQAQLAKLCSPAALLERTSQMALGTVAPNPILAADGTAAGGELAASR